MFQNVFLKNFWMQFNQLLAKFFNASKKLQNFLEKFVIKNICVVYNFLELKPTLHGMC
jgi:hypothetical protein